MDSTPIDATCPQETKGPAANEKDSKTKILCSECGLRPGYEAAYKCKPESLADEDWFDPKRTYYTPCPSSDTEDPVYLCEQCDPFW